MRKIFLLFLLLAPFTWSQAQVCSPNPAYVFAGVPGIWPIPQLGISEGQVNMAYSETMTVIVPNDTTIDLSAITGIPGLPTATVDINSLRLDNVANLPNGITYTCDTNCTWNAGSTGCFVISGTPTAADTIVITLEGALNVTLPSTLPPPFGGNPFDIPFVGQDFDLIITGGVSVDPSRNGDFYVLQNSPNPTQGITSIEFHTAAPAEVTFEVFDLNGSILHSAQVRATAGINQVSYDASGLANGLYFYSLTSEEGRVVRRMAVQ